MGIEFNEVKYNPPDERNWDMMKVEKNITLEQDKTRGWFKITLVTDNNDVAKYYRITQSYWWKELIDDDNAKALWVSKLTYINEMKKCGALHNDEARGLVFYQFEKAQKALKWIESALIARQLAGGE